MNYAVTVKFTEQVTEDRWERHEKTNIYSADTPMSEVISWAKRVSGSEKITMNNLHFTHLED